MIINYVPCMKCLQELGRPEYFIHMQLNNDAAWELICPAGHKTQVALQNPKFERFFHMGCLQFLEKNWKNCVHNIITALEEFIGYVIKIICFSSNLEDYCAEIIKSLDSLWERKYGAFIALYLMKFKKNKIIPKKQVEFRNKITHHGYIPTERQAFAYCEFIHNFIMSIQNEINQKISSEILDSFTRKRLEEKNKLFRSDIPPSFFHLNMILNISNQNKTLKEKLVELKPMKCFMHDSSLPEEWIDFQSLKDSPKLNNF